MLTYKNLQKIKQHTVNIGEEIEISDHSIVDYETYKRDCREYLTNKINTEYHDLGVDQQEEFDIATITDFVYNNAKPVSGFVERGRLNVIDLVSKLLNDITYFGILTQPLKDPAISEIEVNDVMSIWVETKGRKKLYIDPETGKPAKFNNSDEILTFVNKLIGSVDETNRLTASNPLINARTRQGYRLSATFTTVNHVGIPPYDYESVSLTIRKQTETQMKINDLIGFGTISTRMGQFLKHIGYASLDTYVVGETNTGKTGTLGVVVNEIKPTKRIGLIQNPTEIIYKVRNADGIITNNAFHWEAKAYKQGAGEKNTSINTVENLITHSLRNNLELLVIGEIREKGEFSEAFRATLTGHGLMASMHSGSKKQAVDRFVREISGGTSDDATYRAVCDIMTIIVTQELLADGTRRITDISETIGYDIVKKEPIFNTIFMFEFDGDSTVKESGVVEKIGGKHVFVNPPTDNVLRKLTKSGLTKDELSYLYIKEDEKYEQI